MKNLGAELAEQIVKHFETDEVRSFLESVKAAPATETGTFKVVITTEHLDRYQEVIKLDGWELEHYRNNPVVLWGHDHNQPIGMATSIEIINGQMIAEGKFAPTEKAQEIRKLYDFGIIKATSVGFIEKEREGNLITRAELLEFSFVSVPANPHALTLAIERGLEINELVTKGLMFVEKDETPHREDIDATGAAGEPTILESDATATPLACGCTDTCAGGHDPAAEKSFSTKQLTPVIDSLKAAVVALEALGITPEAPEGDEAPEAEDEETRKFKEFSEKRAVLQEAATILGEVLAEARHVIDARKAA